VFTFLCDNSSAKVENRDFYFPGTGPSASSGTTRLSWKKHAAAAKNRHADTRFEDSASGQNS
jgi:hypothetical protein